MLKKLSLVNMPSTTAVLSAYTSLTASAFLIRTFVSEFQTIANQLLPEEIRAKILSKIGGLFGNFFFFTTAQMSVVIDEHNGFHINNEIFEASEAYLRTKLSPSSKTDRLVVFKTPQEKSFSFIISTGEKIIDKFEGVEFIWELKVSESQKPGLDYDGNPRSESAERRAFELIFNQKCREMVFSSYIPFVLEKSKAIQEENKIIKIYSLGDWYGEVNLDHPSTFETLAMDPELKKELIEDLDRFVSRKDYYRRVGKAWKRGYLLYGPPGTGKSSLIAAMANYLRFDVYDLDLSSLNGSCDIQRLLVNTKNRSIIVIEDIDCNVQLQNRNADEDEEYSPPPYNSQGDKSKVSLSSLLNFIDGLWSCCGDERIIVFTSNYKDRLDPALLRPGRMDMHIHMSYCTPTGFRVLASNYHHLKDHFKFAKIDQLLAQVDVTPAEIAEELMKSDEADVALKGLVKFMKKKKIAHHNDNDDDNANDDDGDAELKVGGSESGGISDVSKIVAEKSGKKNNNKKRKKAKKMGRNFNHS
ncbi:PREDICTED: AAA-ATPase At3g50940-like [Ipomoea nil]|uniref:AAA-ATPase At3g50940-like n=1 Tax=Ipomoea nil TaxID=35883 RepID=UPI000900DDB0|nr:PREDICTED: AAA-ATPase At3g50940-like [Ipomoea nil]